MDMDYNQIISLSILTTVVGMSMTFIVLVFLMFVMRSLKYIGRQDSVSSKTAANTVKGE